MLLDWFRMRNRCCVHRNLVQDREHEENAFVWPGDLVLGIGVRRTPASSPSPPSSPRCFPFTSVGRRGRITRGRPFYPPFRWTHKGRASKGLPSLFPGGRLPCRGGQAGVPFGV